MLQSLEIWQIVYEIISLIFLLSSKSAMRNYLWNSRTPVRNNLRQTTARTLTHSIQANEKCSKMASCLFRNFSDWDGTRVRNVAMKGDRWVTAIWGRHLFSSLQKFYLPFTAVTFYSLRSINESNIEITCYLGMLQEQNKGKVVTQWFHQLINIALTGGVW